jgi:hypothetical protein
VTTVVEVTDPTWLDIRHDDIGERSGGVRRRRKQYLPSAQVLRELTTLGPDLGKLAEELRQRLSEPTADLQPRIPAHW